MSSDRRRSAGRRRAWGRGPVILRFEPLEGRQLLATSPLPDLAAVAFDTVHNLDWGDSFHAKGIIANQGNAAVSTPFRVNIYASTGPDAATGSVLLGQVTIPAGLQPGQQVPFDQVVNLPVNGMSGVANGSSLYVGLVVDPDNLVAESNKLNNLGAGQGYDLSVVTLTPRKPSALVGAGIGVYPDQAAWGQTIQVSAKIYNDAEGEAPATRARVVLTPVGTTPGGPADVTIGNLQVPAVGAWQSVTVSQAITLPKIPPATLVGNTQFVLSVIQDADFVTSAVSPHVAWRGLGFDMTQLQIATPADPTAGVTTARPEMTVTSVQAPSIPLAFGQTFQVTATVQNNGKLESGPYRVRFLLVGSAESLDNALFLGDAAFESLQPGGSHNLVQTLTLPIKLPSGMTLNSSAQARIAVLVDPERVIDDAYPSNNAAVSNVVTLRIVSADGQSTLVTSPPTTTPTTQRTTTARRATGTTPAAAQAPRAGATARARAAAAAAARKSKFGPAAVKTHTASHNLKVFPKHVTQFVKDLFT
ncbi:MAG: CARDB domain-containing protein [Isosphaeraceae bacterium]